MEKKPKEIKFKPGETPTPVRMMEDPTLWHVMPSRKSKSKRNDSMPPPPRKEKKIVLDEEEYTETLGKVIERDYFPDLDKYRTHLEVDLLKWSDCLVFESCRSKGLRPSRAFKVSFTCYPES